MLVVGDASLNSTPMVLARAGSFGQQCGWLGEHWQSLDCFDISSLFDFVWPLELVLGLVFALVLVFACWRCWSWCLFVLLLSRS